MSNHFKNTPSEWVTQRRMLEMPLGGLGTALSDIYNVKANSEVRKVNCLGEDEMCPR